jgi:hypothetical protein
MILYFMQEYDHIEAGTLSPHVKEINNITIEEQHTVRKYEESKEA